MGSKPFWKSRTLLVEMAKGTLTILIGSGLWQAWGIGPEMVVSIVVGLRVAEHILATWLRFITREPLGK